MIRVLLEVDFLYDDKRPTLIRYSLGTNYHILYLARKMCVVVV